MGGLSIWHLIILLVVVLLVFGSKRLRNLGPDLGHALKGFRSAMKDGEREEEDPDKDSSVVDHVEYSEQTKTGSSSGSGSEKDSEASGKRDQ